LNKVFGDLERSPDSKSKCTFSGIITQNHEMQAIIEQIGRVKDSDLTILLQGETGTGKDKLAKAIHYQSRRKDKDFIAVQCSAIPEDLLENALFGHRKGAYTGASENSPGFFEQADGGTLYLDEIADIRLSTQVKLLRFIEEKEITRLGETKPRKIDVRIIASTCCDLSERISQGLFRKDLYYRLNVLPFKLPPLRERKEDIPLLVKYFLNGNGSGEEVPKALESAEFIEKLLSWDWPGNVRDLKNEIERLAVLADVNNGINPPWLQGSTTSSPFDRASEPATEGPLEEQVAEFVEKKIVRALEQAEGNKSLAARILGCPETTLRNKLKKYKIEWHA
jgi:transcriptional regulator with PAS, ATPase and Fis domain